MRIFLWVAMVVALAIALPRPSIPLYVSAVAASPPGAPSRPVLRIWLMPSEPAREPPPGEDPLANIDEQIDKFNAEFCDEWLQVENTTDPKMRVEMVALNRMYVLRNWPVVAGQVETIKTLRRFARQNNCQVIVRFLRWDRAFEDIRTALESSGHPKPDVCQIGTTWRAFFAHEGLLFKPTADQLGQNAAGEPLVWHGFGDSAPTTLRFLYDLRCVYHWHRLPQETDDAKSRDLDTTNWDSLIQSMRQRKDGPRMVLPTLLEGNVLHDYAPLVWAGGAEILSNGKFNLTRGGALRIPQLLSDAMRDEAPVFALPEMSHYEAMQLFLRGEYMAIVEPVGFFPYLKRHFEKLHPSKDFWSHIGVGIPKPMFSGGSDLMIASNRPEAFQLARFIARDHQLQTYFAELGHMPVQNPNHGVDVMLSKLDAPPDFRGRIERSTKEALHNGGSQSYPEHPEWPSVMESPETLEAIQDIWRRISEGADEDRLKQAAAKAEESVNLKIHWPPKLGRFLAENALLLAALVAAPFLIWAWLRRRVREQERMKYLALRLFRARMHEQLHAYGEQVQDFSLIKDCDALRDHLRSYGKHIDKIFNTHIKMIVDAIYLECEGGGDAMTLEGIINLALTGARIDFQASHATSAPEPPVNRDPSEGQWRLAGLPHVLVMVLQEWFYNTLKEIAARPPSSAAIDIQLLNGRGTAELRITTPYPIPKLAMEKLNAPRPSRFQRLIIALRGLVRRGSPSPSLPSARGKGLALIRDLVWYGFDSQVRCVEEGAALIIPLPKLKKVLS